MNILRHYMRLVEANFKISYAYGYRSWYFPSTNEFVKVGPFDTHAKAVAMSPETFGLGGGMIDPKEVVDRAPEIMNAACANGWIRIAGQDRQDPSKNMIFEGSDLDALLKVLKMFFYDQKGELQHAAIKVRSLDGDAGAEYVFSGPDAIKAAVMRAELPAPIHFGHGGGLAA